MLLGGFAAYEGTEVAPPPGLRIFLARIEAVAARFQFPDHLITFAIASVSVVSSSGVIVKLGVR